MPSVCALLYYVFLELRSFQLFDMLGMQCNI